MEVVVRRVAREGAGAPGGSSEKSDKGPIAPASLAAADAPGEVQAMVLQDRPPCPLARGAAALLEQQHPQGAPLLSSATKRATPPPSALSAVDPAEGGEGGGAAGTPKRAKAVPLSAAAAAGAAATGAVSSTASPARVPPAPTETIELSLPVSAALSCLHMSNGDGG